MKKKEAYNPPPKTAPRRRQVIRILAVFAAVVCLDQVSKAVIMSAFPEPEAYFGGAPHFFRFTHQRNPGVVGGMFRENPVMARAAPIAATLILLYLFWHLDPSSRFQSLAYGLIAGGAVGNLIDRLRLGSVTDFLEFNFYFVPFNFPWKHFPAFNLADSCICVGVFTLILCWWSMPEEKPAADRS